MTTSVAVIDYGMGNLRSVVKAIEHVAPHASVRLTSNAAEIENADRVVFPGQGAIAGCMAALDELHLRSAAIQAAKTKPFLGICLGLQALFDFSEEYGGVNGLGVLPGRVLRFQHDVKVPHIGWNQVQQTKPHPLWDGIPDESLFYFAHSYYVGENTDAVGTTEYGLRFTSAIARGNIFAVQFHPEKSSQAGLMFLRNFMAWDGVAC